MHKMNGIFYHLCDLTHTNKMSKSLSKINSIKKEENGKTICSSTES